MDTETYAEIVRRPYNFKPKLFSEPLKKRTLHLSEPIPVGFITNQRLMFQ